MFGFLFVINIVIIVGLMFCLFVGGFIFVGIYFIFIFLRMRIRSGFLIVFQGLRIVIFIILLIL